MMPSMNPRILVLGLESDEDYLSTYTKAVAASGGDPDRRWLSASMRHEKALVEGFLAAYDGVVLPGGADIDPRHYGEGPRPEMGATNAELDEGQLAAARVLLRCRIPVLAICRGMQLLAVAAGGTLIQDLPSQKPSPISHNVKNPKDYLAHDVEVETSSRLAALCGAGRFAVNSRHHQAVRERAGEPVGSCRIVARAADGVPEGMEDLGHPFLVAVQWHPENLVYGNAQAMALFRGFIEAARERAAG
jgi:putative glutamine amidotransferase